MPAKPVEIVGHISYYDAEKAGLARVRPLWWQLQGLSYTRSGYGRKIPTSREVKHNGSWRRVYCCIYSNSGTNYITAPGGKNWIVVY
jgi:hypothetical protein